MLDIILEIVRAIIMAAIVGYLLWIGAKENIGRRGGWTAIITGFGLILFGGILDITDNFDSLNRFVIIGDTRVEALLEKVLGFLLGFCFLAMGLWRWIPMVVAGWKSEEALREANAQLVEAQDQLIRSEKLAAIGQLAGGVAHDLRTPLGAINNAIYYVKRRLGNPDFDVAEPKIGQLLQVAADEVDHSNQIKSDLLELARVGVSSLSPTNLGDAVSDALSTTEIRDNVHVVKHFDPSLPEVLADGEQLYRVFINLAGNAQDAMPDGGVLTISTRQTGDYAEVVFQDTGAGISDEQMVKIFEPLFTTKIKGTGLGLAVCQQIVAKHSGTIHASSTPGEGASFTVQLPLDIKHTGG